MKLKALVTLLIDFIAVYRLTKLVIDDEIMEEVREAIWEKFPAESTKIGYLITCPWCTSIWMGAAIFAMRKLHPESTDYITKVLASSAVTGVAFNHGL